MRRVDLYRDVTGVRRAEVFLASLPAKVGKKVIWVFDLIREVDRVPGIYLSKMSGTDEIWECRMTFGGAHYRFLAFMDGDTLLLTHGFKKKTQKTPLQEIRFAEQCRRQYFFDKERTNG